MFPWTVKFRRSVLLPDQLCVVAGFSFVFVVLPSLNKRPMRPFSVCLSDKKRDKKEKGKKRSVKKEPKKARKEPKKVTKRKQGGTKKKQPTLFWVFPSPDGFQDRALKSLNCPRREVR